MSFFGSLALALMRDRLRKVEAALDHCIVRDRYWWGLLGEYTDLKSRIDQMDVRREP